MNDTPDPSAVAHTLHQLATTADRLADALRSQSQNQHGPDDPDVGRAVLGALMYAYLTHVWADVDHPRFMPGAGFYTQIGTPNPDTYYRTTAIDGRGTYRLTGDPGTAPEVSLMPFGGPTATGVQTFPPLDVGELSLDSLGHFDVTLSAVRPAGHTGDWWQIDPGVRSLMLRSVSADWGAHREPLVAIVRVDTPPRRSRLDAAEATSRLGGLAKLVDRSLTYGLAKVERLRADEVVNRLVGIDYSGSGGLVGQWYLEGVFDLGESDALLVELPVPPGGRFSLSLTDPLFCTIDWTHAQSSLNHRQAWPDADGILRVVVAGFDPGVVNWLDTTGYRSGVVQCRFTDWPDEPSPSVEVVPLTDLPARLGQLAPTLTSAERSDALRARAVAAQLRSLW